MLELITGGQLGLEWCSVHEIAYLAKTDAVMPHLGSGNFLLPLVLQPLPEVVREELEGASLDIIVLAGLIRAALEIERGALNCVIDIELQDIHRIFHGLKIVVDVLGPSRGLSALLLSTT